MSALVPVKPIFIIPNNPRPEEPLWPRPHGSAGYLLAKMVSAAVGWSEAEYLQKIERISLCQRLGVRLNLQCDGPGIEEARKAAEAVRIRIGGRKAVCIGRVTQTLFGAPEEPLVWCDGLAYFPHPGRNPWFSDPLNFEHAVQFLRELLDAD
jgi:hypothetical protein